MKLALPPQAAEGFTRPRSGTAGAAHPHHCSRAICPQALARLVKSQGAKDQRAAGFLKLAKSKGVMAYACLMADVLEQLTKLSSIMQRRDSSLADVLTGLECMKVMLTLYQTQPGPQFQKFEAERGEGKYRDLKKDNRNFAESRRELIQGLFRCLENRFQEGTRQELIGRSCYPEPQASLALKGKQSRAEVNCQYGAECQNLLGLIDLLLTLPSSTAECERGFNSMKLIKSDWRASLASPALNDLMAVLLLSPEVSDFDPGKAIQLWFKDSTRSRMLSGA
ncbi:hypothetical protein SKAU_G00129320 [Synaphobranchus kaupii]|uniref:HAT C-terminal dimerisation domain-containing protein n=1 Tax=Synaphobranchus kaupii TaxID=118154 RepID=A0A9Q1J2U7_SYNKA|nr:hypothetical protein SKAU_G00129320 [Synaphobranchus kaupii]